MKITFSSLTFTLSGTKVYFILHTIFSSFLVPAPEDINSIYIEMTLPLILKSKEHAAIFPEQLYLRININNLLHIMMCCAVLHSSASRPGSLIGVYQKLTKNSSNITMIWISLVHEIMLRNLLFQEIRFGLVFIIFICFMSPIPPLPVPPRPILTGVTRSYVFPCNK